jgi:drug/metabolite transporter (DMT)-like permease
MDWFFYATVASISFTVYSIIIRKYLQHSDAKIFAVISNTITGMLLLIVTPFFPFHFSLQPLDYFLILIASILFAVSSMLFTLGRKMEEASIVSVIRQTSVLWIFLGGLFIFHEPLSFAKGIGVLLLMSGTVVALWDKNNLNLSRGEVYIFIATITLSIDSLIAKNIVGDKLSPAFYSALTLFIGNLFLLPFLKQKRERIVKEIKQQRWHIVTVSVFLAISILSLLIGYQSGDISKVYPVYNSYVILTVIAGILFLQEKADLKQKILGSFIAFCGVVLLRMF